MSWIYFESLFIVFLFKLQIAPFKSIFPIHLVCKWTKHHVEPFLSPFSFYLASNNFQTSFIIYALHPQPRGMCFAPFSDGKFNFTPPGNKEVASMGPRKMFLLEIFSVVFRCGGGIFDRSWNLIVTTKLILQMDFFRSTCFIQSSTMNPKLSWVDVKAIRWEILLIKFFYRRSAPTSQGGDETSFWKWKLLKIHETEKNPLWDVASQFLDGTLSDEPTRQNNGAKLTVHKKASSKNR